MEEYGVEVGKEQIAHSDIEQEQDLAKKLLEFLRVEKRIPEIDEIKKLLRDGWVIICNINSDSLDGRPGYTGHFVVVKRYDEEGLYINDPGLPPKANRKVDFVSFERAWAYPNEKAKNIMAFLR